MQRVNARPSGRRQYQFGPYRLDVEERRLWRNGDTVALTSRVFDVLAVLVANSGRPIDKDEIMRQVWPDSIVEEGNLTRNVSTLRKVLGDSPEDHQYIITLPGRGYQFVQPVQEILPAEFLQAPTAAMGTPLKEANTEILNEPLATEVAAAKRVRRRIYAVGVVFLAVLLAALTWLALELRWKETRSPRTQTLAVLPFHWLNSEPADEHVGIGMADTLITRLGNLRQVIVRPTSSVLKYQSAQRDLQETGRTLRVELVLEGSLRRVDDRIRATVRLINVHDGSTVWADKFDEAWTDLLKVEDSIAERMVAALPLRLTGEERRRLTKRYTENVEAYQLYINGRFYWEKRTQEGLKRGIEYFGAAIGEDPNYALAYAGLADAYALLGVFHLPPKEAFPKAKDAALNALRIDDRLAEAHAALGHVKVQYEYDWAGAEREYQRAIELNPNYVNAHHFYALYLTIMGRFDEGIDTIRRAQELEPFSLFIHANAGQMLYQARRYDDAISQLKKVLEMNPNFDHAHNGLGMVYLVKGMYEQAIAEFQKRTTPAALGAGNLGQAYGLSGRRTEAHMEIDKLQTLSRQRYVAPYNLAIIYASLGDKGNALEWLEKAYDDRSTGLIWIKVDPRLDTLRSEPRFKAVLKRMGLALNHSDRLARPEQQSPR